MAEEMKVGVSLLARLADKTVEDQTGYSPTELGERAAEQAIPFTRANKLGYFPPLAYLAEQGAIDRDFFLLVSQVAELVNEYVRKDVCLHLYEAFSLVEATHAQNIALTMPKIRRHQTDAQEGLALHYSPAHVKLDLEIGTSDHDELGVDLELLVRNRAIRWLKERFVSIEVTETHPV